MYRRLAGQVQGCVELEQSEAEAEAALGRSWSDEEAVVELPRCDVQGKAGSEQDLRPSDSAAGCS